MNELQTIASVRPAVKPLRRDERARLRTELFPQAAITAPQPIERSIDVLPEPHHAPRGRRRVLPAAAAIIALTGAAGVWAAANRDAASAPQAAPSTTSPATDAAPKWYGMIRPFLPDGFDQIVLGLARPEVVSFKAFRTGTQQVLDITIVLEPGYENKKTDDAPTFTDQHGEYFESVGAVALFTPDMRFVSVACGLLPIEGSAIGPLSPAGSDRDYCGDGFDDLGVDRVARRALVVRLASEFPLDAVTANFGEPQSPPSESERVIELLTPLVADPQFVFNLTQHEGVLRVANLNDDPSGPTTELTVIHGVWPARPPAISADPLAPLKPPSGRFQQYEGIAVALIVAPDGTGYHIATTGLDDDNLVRLGALLEQLAAVPSDTDQIAPQGTTTAAPTTSTTVAPSAELTRLLEPRGTVRVVNAAGVAGLAGSLTVALEASGFKVVEPVNAADGIQFDSSVMYARSESWEANRATTAAIERAVPTSASEALDSPPPAISDEIWLTADVFIVVGKDYADAPWEDQSEPLFDPGVGVLMVVDATSTADGHTLTESRAQQLRDQGVAIAGVAEATRDLPETMLMPIGRNTPWTYAVAELAGIGGFDTWSPDLLGGPLRDDITAVLVVGDE